MKRTLRNRRKTVVTTVASSQGLNSISIRGARVHNLKNISLDLPRNKLIVITGVSGSGKSSLAFDTIYAEGQRRYVESLSSYARQFLERMDKPDVDLISGLSPAIAIEQKSGGRNPRSTVATATEVYDYLRLLFGRVGQTFCPVCGKRIRRDTVATVLDWLGSIEDGTRFYIGIPFPRHAAHSFDEDVESVKKRGFVRVLLGSSVLELESAESSSLTDSDSENLSIIIDRLVVDKSSKEFFQRAADSVETAFREGQGYVRITIHGEKKAKSFSHNYECPEDKIRFEEPDPKLFSFNSPSGACPECQGFGRAIGIDRSLVVPDETKSIRDGAIHPWTMPSFRGYLRDFISHSGDLGVPVEVPFGTLTSEKQELVFRGKGRIRGVDAFFRKLEAKNYKIQNRVFLSRYRGYTVCNVCNGSRVRPEALNIQVDGKTIHDVVRMSIATAVEFVDSIHLEDEEGQIARRILAELRRRLRILLDVGLGYITLDRLMMTLSGGESQRISLATALGSSLVGSIYILDEPSIGLHPRDNNKLVAMLQRLRAQSNTVIVVEHDEDMIRKADVIVDLGPRAGEFGGEVVALGALSEILNSPTSLTGDYLSGRKSISLATTRRRLQSGYIEVLNAREHNLKNISLRIPLGGFVCITGVSGSGKSTLVHEILFKSLAKQTGQFQGIPGKVDDVRVNGPTQSVELVDQSPVGRSPRSNPVTYLKAFDGIRELLSETPLAKVRGFTPTYFSFNVPGGRCDACEGDGVQKIEMQFLADLYLECEVCHGTRFKRDVLDVKYHGKNVHDILSMTVTEALAFFGSHLDARKVTSRLKILNDVGLGYVRLGQSATTLSGGEAQRMKIAFHLSEGEKRRNTLFILDEPTTGLHFDDIRKLLDCLNALIENGNSVLAIEHNLHVIKNADYLIDLGPEGGDDGGSVVATGTPEEVVEIKGSYTGSFLGPYLKFK